MTGPFHELSSGCQSILLLGAAFSYSFHAPGSTAWNSTVSRQSFAPFLLWFYSKRHSMTPDRRSMTLHRHSTTPDRRSMTLHRHSTTPDRRSMTLHRHSTTPDRRSMTPHRRSMTPHRHSTTPDVVR
jgi:hypothetical protein